MLIAGVDEAGRGPLAGPVTVAAVILQAPIDGLDDSKKLKPADREALAAEIKRRALAWSVHHIGVEVIDEINILQATLQGMQAAVASLDPRPDRVLIDGNQNPIQDIESRAIVGGDGIEAVISAASILAKTERDAHMQTLHARYPNYGFDCHKGYATAAHRRQLKLHGPCAAHRRSFAPVAAFFQGQLFES